jgi:glycolate oxidase
MITVPISRYRIPGGIQEIGQRHGMTIATYGHAGDGNLHPQLLYDEYDPKQVERVEKAEEEIFKLAISLHGTLSGEHGIGLSKANYMTLEHDPVEMTLMRQIRPWIPICMNPGKASTAGAINFKCQIPAFRRRQRSVNVKFQIKF